MAWKDVIAKMEEAKISLQTELEKAKKEYTDKVSLSDNDAIQDLSVSIEGIVLNLSYIAEHSRESTDEEKRLEEVQAITAADDFKKTINRDKDGKITSVVFESAKLDKKATMIPDEKDVLKKYTLLTLSAEG